MIIGISGFKGSGKDEFYKLLHNIDSTYNKLAFADPIKDQIMNIFDLKDEMEYDNFKRSNLNGICCRRIVREIGMLMRGYNPNQFVEYIEQNLTPNVCITDVRFENEIRYLTNLKETNKVILVKIKRYTSDDLHITEFDLPDDLFDYIIENSDSLENYQNKIYNFYINVVQKGEK